MKIVLFLVATVVAQMSFASNVVFSCQNKLQSTLVEMNVTKAKNGFEATLIGSTFSGPQNADFIVATPSDALNVPGVREIITTLKITKAEWQNVSEVEVYTVGNFEDDGAGVRGVNFLNRSGNTLKKGMFFGWAGPIQCL